MKGRNWFKVEEISQLKCYVRKKQSALPGEQKPWRDKMRALGFYISDYQGGGEGFSDGDLDRLIEHGAVEVLDQPSAGGAVNKAAKPEKDTGPASPGGSGAERLDVRRDEAWSWEATPDAGPHNVRYLGLGRA